MLSFKGAQSRLENLQTGIGYVKQRPDNHLLLHGLLKLVATSVAGFLQIKKPLKSDLMSTNKGLRLLANEVVQALEKTPERAMVVDKNGDTPLHMMSRYCVEFYEIGTLLLSSKDSVVASGEEDILSNTVAYIFIQLLKYSDPNAANKQGDTPLHILATVSERMLGFNIHAFLLAKEAEPDVKNHAKKTAIDLAQAWSYDADLLLEVDLFKPNSFLAFQETSKVKESAIEAKYQMRQDQGAASSYSSCQQEQMKKSK